MTAEKRMENRKKCSEILKQLNKINSDAKLLNLKLKNSWTDWSLTQVKPIKLIG